MSDIINILPDSVANQIAAGEVVDRPASAVKELLENAIDAGASQIQLIVKDAGRTLIQVIDNGCGMSDSDARLCFERHATSKIKQSDDLFNILTMGFRGEALASIAAIAQVELKTRQPDKELGTHVINEGCQIKGQTPEACPVGTSIAIKNLFFNVPARRNFLKKDSIELSHIEEVFRRVTLANCQCDFSFYSNGKMLYDLRAGNLLQRICQLYGSNYNERFFPVKEDNELVAVNGYIGKPEYAKKSRGEQYLFVNNRFIKHPALSTAIEKAYTDLIPDRYVPSYFLNLSIDPSRIDINIHPTKTEVKFIDEHALFALLRAAAKKALGQYTLSTAIEFNPSEEFDFSPPPEGYIPQQPRISYNPDYNPFNPPPSTKPFSGGYNASSHHDTPKGSTPHDEPPSRRWENFFDQEDTPNQYELPQQQPSSTISTDNHYLQVGLRWIVSTMNAGLLIVDQQRASERIIYEQLMNSPSVPINAQHLLFPINCTFSPADADLFAEMLPDLRQCGFEIDALGHNTFVVSAIPTGINDQQLQLIFDQMLADRKSAMLQKFTDRDQSLCRSLSRQMALRAGQPLNEEEMNKIVADLFCCQVPNLSPFGQKTLVVLNSDQLNKLL
ncbi:MAG: DNA mismatch repair endonuclease MutL [Bacteroidales bacterium]|nr:DNA mismatch repair endonuclease MutL [Bacteroidales bacterium]